MKKLIFILPLLYYSCTDDIVADIDALQTENAEQDAQIDSLLTVITTQQEYIDSMNNIQNAYIDSLISESMINDSLLQVYTDSLNTVQNTLNADQQAYIDSLINLGNVSDSLLQVYTDSLNTVQNTYIDSLHNAQQTTLTALANSALSAGFVETQVFSGTQNCDTFIQSGGVSSGWCHSNWQDLDLSENLGKKTSLVLIKVIATMTDGHSAIHYWRPNDSNEETPDVGTVSSGDVPNSGDASYILVLTDSQGIIDWKTSFWSDNSTTWTVSVVFYLNQ